MAILVNWEPMVRNLRAPAFYSDVKPLPLHAN